MFALSFFLFFLLTQGKYCRGSLAQRDISPHRAGLARNFGWTRVHFHWRRAETWELRGHRDRESCTVAFIGTSTTEVN